MAQLQCDAEVFTGNIKMEDDDSTRSYSRATSSFEESPKAEIKPTVQLDIHTCHTSVSARESAQCYIIHLLERCTVG